MIACVLQIIPSVNEKEPLIHQLLSVVGLRVKLLLNKDVSYYSYFTPAVTTWIETLVRIELCNSKKIKTFPF